MSKVYEVIIIGGGPAGLSGALVLGRCGRRVLICDDRRPRNAKSHAMHGYLSRDAIAPATFLQEARKDVARYPTVDSVEIEVTDVAATNEGFEVTLADGAVARSKKLLIATGLVDELPRVDGLRERWGTSVFPCPFCDAWEYRGKPIAIYGTEYRASCGFAREMLTWSQQLTLLTDASEANDVKETERLDRLGIRVDRRRLLRVEGPELKLEKLVFEDGTEMPCEALFVMTEQHQRNGFAEKLGCTPLTDDGAVPTSSLQHTRARGVYVAGNASVGLQSAILAAAEGFKAAYAINDELIDELVAERLGEVPPCPIEDNPPVA